MMLRSPCLQEIQDLTPTWNARPGREGASSLIPAIVVRLPRQGGAQALVARKGVVGQFGFPRFLDLAI